ncbi:MAG: CoA transferase subunit A [Deltaproteobacteria bacterium]|nr:CoA transferase subunit A [Deltaproteobacteria bacterium]MBW2121643.1 CoA transferase subunit A [Deltaproteobacteria bacterium]
MAETTSEKVMTAREAVERFVFDGAVVGLGGQNVGRCTVAIAHEIVRQGKKDLTLCGCNLSIPMDIMVGAGLVKRTEAGTGNLERFGTTFCWRRAVERGTVEMEDYSHLAMVSRFLAGEMGLPFMPIKSLLGSDMLTRQARSTLKKYELIDNPWNPGEKVVLLPALNPDVAIIHAQKADPMGNVIIEGFLAHDVEMVRAAKHTIVSCEEIIPTERIRNDPERTTIPYLYVSAVVEQPFGAHPTAAYRYYDYDTDHLNFYQRCAREGGKAYEAYLRDYVLDCETFEDYLDKVGGLKKMMALKKAMQEML